MHTFRATRVAAAIASFAGVMTLSSAQAIANEAPKAEAHGAKPKGGGHGPTPEEEANKAAAESQEITDRYVHRWMPLPKLTGSHLAQNIPVGNQKNITARKGRATVILFLASWCEPCQQLITEFRRLETLYTPLDTDFVYVFMHDTREDALGFMKEYRIENAVLGNQEILKSYHNPELPSMYVADRRGWMATRVQKASGKDLAALDELMKKMTAL